MLKGFLSVLVLCSLLACNSQSSIEKSADSTQNVVDSQKAATKDSVISKSDSNKRVIDSSFKVLKDSIDSVK